MSRTDEIRHPAHDALRIRQFEVGQRLSLHDPLVADARRGVTPGGRLPRLRGERIHQRLHLRPIQPRLAVAKFLDDGEADRRSGMLPHISDLEIPDEAGLFIDPSGQFDPFGLVPAVVESLHIVAECTVALLRQRFEGRAVSLPLGLGGAAREREDGIAFRSVAHGIHGRAIQKYRKGHRQVPVQIGRASCRERV